MTELPPLWKEKLTHMLGAGSHIPKAQHGYRNYFCVQTESYDEDYHTMVTMERAGLVKVGKMSQYGVQFFHATDAGCRAIGLSDKAVQRAMEV